MALLKFTGDKDKYEINHMEWLRLVNEYDMATSGENKYFLGGSFEVVDEY
jgi:hypothetical protein